MRDMRLGIPVNGELLATVADFAQRLLLIDMDGVREMQRDEIDFSIPVLPAKVAALSDNGVNILICGAVSRPFAAMASHSGIDIIPFVSGRVDDVLDGFCRGCLDDPRFSMPGGMDKMGPGYGRRCRGRGRSGGGRGFRRGR